MSLIMAVSLISCNKTDKNNKNAEKEATEKTEVTETADKEDKLLQGEWAEDRTYDELKTVFDEKFAKIEEVTKATDIKYNVGDDVKKIEGKQVTEKAIYFDNEKPEDNKMESMYFGMKVYGEDLTSGEIELKLSLKFDGEGAIKNGDFDLGKTAFADFIKAFTGEENRDYSSINKNIIDKLKSGQKEIIVSGTTKDGLKEEYLADKDYIVYKLSTKKYIFADAEMSME